MHPPLKDIRVLDLTRMLSGPYCTVLLADLGAEVIKIEDPDGGDKTRTMGPKLPGGMSAYFLSINRNKQSLTLNLRTEKGRDLLYRLVQKSDVLVSNFRPDALKKLGCEYQTISRFNPRIVFCSITAYGMTGPDRNLPAFDLTLQARGGAMSITGELGRPPVRMGIPTGDLAGGMGAALAIVSALFDRQRTGHGREIDISLLDCQVSLLTYVSQYFFQSGEVPGPIGSGHQTVVPYQAFQTADGYIVIAIFVEKFWEKLCTVLNAPHLTGDVKYRSNELRRQHRAELNATLQERFLTKTSEEWLHLLREEGIPSAPVATVDRVFDDSQIKARNLVTQVTHPVYGEVPTVDNPLKMTGIPEGMLSPAPLLGEDTDRILSKLLGLNAKEIEDLRTTGVI
jgi:crotonobetainyl-CoA:carnitine CoA-transferase CaiB-like acyl-CoA transferase